MRITLEDIHKHYGPVKANNGVSLCVDPGTIHGILGENGAGKSTLMKILAGYSQKTRGTILMDGVPVDDQTPARASRLGIGMLYQDPLDFPLLSVLENFMLGQESSTCAVRGQGPGASGFFPKMRLAMSALSAENRGVKGFRDQLSNLSHQFDFKLDPDEQVRELSIGERQQLEILRLLALGTQVLILDEPTTGISGVQKETLFQALRKLASEGKSIILVSHKLEDVESLCDQVTVLRQGRVSGGMGSPFDTRALLEMMFGTPPHPPPRCLGPLGKDVLVMKDVSVSGGRTCLSACNLVIRQGEMVGLAGLEGSGQGVFLRAAAGLKSPSQGDIHVQGMNMNKKGYHAFKGAGVNFLPGSRLEQGLIPSLTIEEHFALGDKRRGLLVRWANACQTAKEQIEKFCIRGTPESPVESLSGGNQQRLLLSLLSENPVLLLLENPTRGLDLASAHWVWQHLRKYCEHGTSIVFSSSELDEILMVADRVLVFFDGAIVKDVRTDETHVRELGRAIAGIES